MTHWTRITLGLVALLGMSAPYAQGPKGPSGSGAMNAEKQAQSTSPPRSGNAQTNRQNTTPGQPDSSTEGTARRHEPASNPVDAEGAANTRSASGDSRNATANTDTQRDKPRRDKSTVPSSKK